MWSKIYSCRVVRMLSTIRAHQLIAAQLNMCVSLDAFQLANACTLSIIPRCFQIFIAQPFTLSRHTEFSLHNVWWLQSCSLVLWPAHILRWPIPATGFSNIVTYHTTTWVIRMVESTLSQEMRLQVEHTNFFGRCDKIGIATLDMLGKVYETSLCSVQ